MSLVKSLIAAAAASILLTGCDATDAIESILNSNVIYVVNGTGGAINISVTGQNDRTIESRNSRAADYLLTGKSHYDVSYDGGHTKNFRYGSVYLYAATTCKDEGFLSDEVDGNRVHIVNLTGETFTDAIRITDTKGIDFNLTDDVNACDVLSTNQANGINVGNGMKVTIGDGIEFEVSGIPSAVVTIANTVKFDVVLYSMTEGTIVPMAGYDDLIK